MSHILDLSFNLQSLGIGWGTLVMFLMLVTLLLTGMPLAFVTLLVALIFALGWFGPMSIPLITSRVYSFVMNFVFVSVPMFVLMAAILDRSGIARDLFDAMKLFAGRIRGGVAIQTVFVSVILAAMSGIIGGEIVLLGMIALPQMLRLGYDRNLSIGIVCAGGSLGTMIPPSIVLIIYGLTANVSIGELFTAAFLPGFMLAMFYVAYILFRAYVSTGYVPAPETEPIPTAEKIRLLKGLALPILVVVIVLGSIYGGIASVTEASAIGVGGVVLSTILRGEFSYTLMRDAAMQTLRHRRHDRLDRHRRDSHRRGLQPDGRRELRLEPDHRRLGQSDRDHPVDDGHSVRSRGISRLGRDRASHHADLRADRARPRHGPGLVRRPVLHEHADLVPVASLRPRCLLSEIRHAAGNLAWRHLQVAVAVHLFADHRGRIARGISRYHRPMIPIWAEPPPKCPCGS